ncbi:MAG TPA: 50S ribosomal protein L9 [Candidatus Latescibacteria bacterium]|nr:50S ribosomal protein L9 [Candidatus Latescibacterota bacterium]
MKVILLRDINTVGSAGEIVSVANGYARNFLIPKRQALMATDANVAKFESQRRQHEAVADRDKRSAEAQAAELEKVSLTATVRVGEGERLFGSVTTQNIADLLKEQGHDVDRRKIELEEPIRALGVYTLPIRLEHDVKASVKLWVVKE